MSLLSGRVAVVQTTTLGEPAMATAAIGATTVYVADASTFNEFGGLVSVNDLLLAYSAIDVELNTITMSTTLVVAIDEQDMVYVSPPTPIKTATVELPGEGDSIPATVPHSLLDKLPDGIRVDGAGESVTLEKRGVYEYVVADVIGEPLTQASLDYIESEEGYGLTQAVAQVQDLNAIGQVNASGITTDTITLGGVDLASQLALASVGKILGARLPSGSNIALSTTAAKIFELNCGTLPGGRTYRINTAMLLLGTAPLALADCIRFSYVYTTDGTTPTTASPQVGNGINEGNFVAGANVTVKPEAEFDLASTAQVKIGLIADVIAGGGAYSIYAGASATARPIMSLYDDGPSGTRQDSAITLTGGGVSRFVKTYNATWAFGINGDYGATILDSYFHIGGESDSCGFVGFDSASMVAQLAGATTPVSCVLRWRPRSRQTSAGLDARVATHNFSSSSAASAASGGLPLFANANLATYGLTLLSNIRNDGVPGASYDESLGTTVFNQFKAGSRKGVGILGTPAASVTGGEGTVYGDGSYQMQLIFTYDGTS